MAVNLLKFVKYLVSWHSTLKFVMKLGISVLQYRILSGDTLKQTAEHLSNFLATLSVKPRNLMRFKAAGYSYHVAQAICKMRLFY
jgi:hypothetical protein